MGMNVRMFVSTSYMSQQQVMVVMMMMIMMMMMVQDRWRAVWE